MKDYAVEQSYDKSKLYADKVGLILNNYGTVLITVANQPSAKAWDNDFLLGELTDINKRFGQDILNAFMVNMNGEVKDIQGRQSSLDRIPGFGDMNMDSSSYVVTPVIIDPLTDETTFAIGTPIQDEEGRQVGAIGVTINLETFANSIEGYKLAGDSYPWITDGEGKVVVHPNHDYIYHVSLGDAEGIGYEGFNVIAQSILNDEEGYNDYYDHNIGEDKIVTYAHIPGAPGWSLNITTVQSGFVGAIDDIVIREALVALVIILLISLFLYQYVSDIIRPISTLTEAVEESMNADINRIELSSNISEIQRLIHGYNRMAETISVHTHELEAQVKARTNELDALNAQLNEQNELLVGTVTKLNEKASKDALTTLNNRPALYRYLKLMFSWVGRGDIDSFSVLFIDLDSFKYFNDSFGHDVGDKILVDIAGVLRDTLRKDDFIARYGGDEFVIVLIDIDDEVADYVMGKLIGELDAYNDRIIDFLERTSYKGDSVVLEKRLGLSYGVCKVDHESAETIDSVLKIADEKMYKNKSDKKIARYI